MPFAQRIRSLYSANVGAWYSPSDLPTLFQDSTGTTPATAVTQPVGLVLDKSGGANNVLQATAAARPTWSNRVNLCPYSEDFGNAAWSSLISGTGTTAVKTPNFDLAPDGTSTACRIQASIGAGTTTGDYSAIRGSVVGGVIAVNSALQSIYIKSNTGVNQSVSIGIGGFSLSVVTATTAWTRVNASAVNNNGAVDIGVRGTYSQQTIDVLVWRPQLQNAGSATDLARYQRSTTATDFDTIGFPYYLSLLGIDDSLSSATGGGGTAGFFYCAAIKREGGAGTLQTLWSDAGASAGYIVQLDVNNKLSFSAGNGTTFTTIVSAAAFNVGDKASLKAWDDGANLNVQIGSGAIASVARPVVVAGTAGFTMFKDNGAASSFALVDLYEQITLKNTAGTAAQRSLAQAYVRSKAGL